MFQQQTGRNSRPFVCHAFLCDLRTPKNNAIYEIEPSGIVLQIKAGISGRGARGTYRSSSSSIVTGIDK